MKCEEIQENLLDYLSGNLEEAIWSRVDDHIAQCKSCAQLLREYSLIDKSLKGSLSKIKQETAFPESMQAEIYRKIRVRKDLNRKFIIYRSIAAMLLLSLGIFLLISIPKKTNIVIPPVTQPNTVVEKDPLEGLEIPKDAESKILLFSKLIGSDKFTLSFNKSKDEFMFIADEVPVNLADVNNHWDSRVQKILDKCFPKTQALICMVENGKCSQFSYIK